MPRRLPSPALALLVAACHPPAIDAPSLSPRPVERQPIATPDPVMEPATAADPVLVGQLAALVADAEAGHRRFEDERMAASGAVRRAARAAAGSDPWVQAQQAVSGLDAAQGPVRDAAAAIDALREQPDHYGSGSRAAIDAAAAKVAVLAEAEATAMAALAKP